MSQFEIGKEIERDRALDYARAESRKEGFSEGVKAARVYDRIYPSSDQAKIFDRFLKDGLKSLSDSERDQLRPQSTRLRGSEFGPLLVSVPAELSKAILSAEVSSANIEAVRQDPGPASLSDVVATVTTGSHTLHVPSSDISQGRFGGVSCDWKTEGAAAHDTEPTYTDRQIPLNELTAYTESSTAIVRRAPLEETLNSLLGAAVREALSQAILQGNGTNRPRGILLDTANSGIQRVHRAEVSKVKYVDLVNLKKALDPGYRTGARFIVSAAAEDELNAVAATSDTPRWALEVMAGLTGGRPPIVMDGVDLGVEGDVICCWPGGYMLGVASEIAIARSDDAEFKKGRTAFRLIMSAGGRMIHPAGFAVLRSTTE